MISRMKLAAVAAATMAVQPTVAAAQQAACLSEDEVSSIALYSVPNVIQAVRLKCNGQLSANGYLARRGDTLASRYVALQNAHWPRAKSGMLKALSGKSNATEGRQLLDTARSLPDNAMRPLVDALIVQEVSAKIDTRNCTRIERVIEAIAPIDPEIAGNLLGTVAGLVNPDEMPVCPRRS